MSEELKACPFCGGPARIVQTTKAPWVVAICWKCDASGGAGSVKDAVESWNNRPVEDQLRARIAELEAANRWIPVSERLPELDLGPASHRVDVVYRVPGENYYLRMAAQYWKEFGWLYKFQNCKEYSFEDYGYVVEYWREFSPMPEPPTQDGPQ